MKNTKKQNKKTITKKALVKKIQEKKIQENKDFRVVLKESAGDIRAALKKTKTSRREYLKRLLDTDTRTALADIAERLALGKIDQANQPLKSDLAKIDTITPLNKPAGDITARQVFGLILAYYNRDTEDGFSRIFPSGLFLENGMLKRLMLTGLIQDNGGQDINQKFIFTDRAKKILEDKLILDLENKLISGEVL